MTCREHIPGPCTGGDGSPCEQTNIVQYSIDLTPGDLGSGNAGFSGLIGAVSPSDVHGLTITKLHSFGLNWLQFSLGGEFLDYIPTFYIPEFSPTPFSLDISGTDYQGSVPGIAAFLTSKIGSSVAFVVLGESCHLELPCDSDLPLVELHWPPLPGPSEVELNLSGLVSTDQIEILIAGETDHGTVYKGIVPDVDAPGLVTLTVTAPFVSGVSYRIFVRRIRDEKVGTWNWWDFTGTDVVYDFIVIDDDVILHGDDNLAVLP